MGSPNDMQRSGLSYDFVMSRPASLGKTALVGLLLHRWQMLAKSEAFLKAKPSVSAVWASLWETAVTGFDTCQQRHSLLRFQNLPPQETLLGPKGVGKCHLI